MRLLLIGNRNHQFIYNYVKHLKKYDSSIIVDILSYETVECEYPNDYLYNKIYYPKLPVILTRNVYLNYVFRHLALIIQIFKLSTYDYIHIHYVERPLQDVLKLFLIKAKGKIITSVWGSDFYKRNKKNRLKIKPLFLHSHKIAFTSNRFAYDFNQFYKDPQIESKICLFKLGLEPLEYLDEVSRDDFHVNIMIGYNARHNQCHIDIINSITECHINNKNIQLLVPLTYPTDDEPYRNSIKTVLSNQPLNSMVYENFLTDKDIAKLRVNTDILIQLQKTDVLSGAMLEHIAAGSIVITGDWLPYDDLDQTGVKLIKLTDRSLVGKKLVEILNDMQYYKRIALYNAEIVKNNYKWDKLIPDCIKVYD